MSYADIDIYLKGFGIDVDSKKLNQSYNSKLVYSKDVLADESEETLISIANTMTDTG